MDQCAALCLPACLPACPRIHCTETDVVFKSRSESFGARLLRGPAPAPPASSFALASINRSILANVTQMIDGDENARSAREFEEQGQGRRRDERRGNEREVADVEMPWLDNVIYNHEILLVLSCALSIVCCARARARTRVRVRVRVCVRACVRVRVCACVYDACVCLCACACVREGERACALSTVACVV